MNSNLDNCTQLFNEISEVKIGPIEMGAETFTFEYKGATYKARQVGRLLDYMLGFTEINDRQVATMAIIDGLAETVH